MTIDQILNMDIHEFSKLSKSELRTATQKLADAANKRIKRAEAAGISDLSPAMKAIEKSGGRISTKGKSMHGLQKEFQRAKKFLESKTSTITGYKQQQKEFTERISGGEGQSMTAEQTKKFWESYNKYMEGHPGEMSKRGGSTRVQERIYDMVMKGYDTGNINEILDKMYRQEYLKEQQLEAENYNEYGGRFFTIDMDEDIEDEY